MKKRNGKVYLIGAGPGSPDLMTARGWNILKEADTVIYDYLVDPRIFSHLNKNTELISCESLFPPKAARASLKRQNAITEFLIQETLKNKRVVRLKSGDPSLFARTLLEVKALAEKKIKYEIVPGITSGSAAAASMGTPLTDSLIASDCIFITGKEQPSKENSLIDWKSVASINTIVFYMGVSSLGKITQQLIKYGREKNTPVAIIENATHLNQRCVFGNLKNINLVAKQQGIKAPAIIIVSKLAQMPLKLNSINREKKILFTGLSPEKFFTRKTCTHLPLIKIQPLENYKKVDLKLKKIFTYDWIVFTSRYGVKYFFARLMAIGLDARALANAQIAAIGQTTKDKLLSFGITPDLIAKNESSLGLLEAFKNYELKGKRLFIPRSNLSSVELVSNLRAKGATVSAIIFYKNSIADHLPEINFDNFDEIMFTSPSTVRNFIKKYFVKNKSVLISKIKNRQLKIKCIGDVTLKEARECNLIN